MRARVEIFSFLALMLMFSGCAGPTFAPDVAPEYLVTRDQTPLYRSGPQQGSAPEERLSKDERVRMLRHEFGYSFVQSTGGQTGYVANEDLLLTQPLPRPPAPVPAGHETLESLPAAVEAPLPRPDLEEMPDDAPAEMR